MSRLNLGNVLFDAPVDWRFYPQPHLVIGSPPSGAGVLQITLAYREVINIPRTHEDCWSAALAFAGQVVEPKTSEGYRAMVDERPMGAASFVSKGDYFRLWYHYTPQGLVIASFSTKAGRVHDTSVREAVNECERIFRSIQLPPPMA